ncbi:MAG: hypothetical protein ABW061_09975 [Polyangiaceae bacterium]
MILTTYVAAAVYLLPIIAFTVLRCRKGSSLWQLATDIPLAISIDLLGVLLLARFMRLEQASLVSRGLWLVGLVAWGAWRAKKRDFPELPAELDGRVAFSALCQSLFAVLCSLTLSRRANIWDRDWHIPLTASLRGQQLPFGNVYEPRVELAYHYTGDALGSMLQTFSHDALHASFALSLAHDLMFALLGVTLAFTLGAIGIKRVAVHLTVLSAMILAGPMVFAQDPEEPGGYSIGNLLSLSYRPHVCLSFVLTVGFAAAVLAGIYRTKRDVRRQVFPSLAAISAVLVMTDETTLVLLGLWIGVIWLYDPGSLADTRGRGALRLGVLVVAILASILAFGGVLGLHAERYPMWLVAPRSPGWNHAPDPLSTAIGLSRVSQDMFTVFGVVVAVIAIAIASRRRETRVIAVSFLVVALAATFGLTCIDFNHSPIENHRWVTLAFLFAPFLTAFLLAEPDAPGAPRRVAGLAALVIYVSCGFGAMSTIDWWWRGPGHKMMGAQYLGEHPLYGVDCRKLTGAHWFEHTTPTYPEERGAYLWIGCHPTFVAGPAGKIDHHNIKIGGAISGRAALEDMYHNMLEPDAPASVACVSNGSRPDRICSAAQSKGVGSCAPSGNEFTLCTVPSSERKRLASH